MDIIDNINMTQKDKIKQLEEQLAQARSHTYVYDTHTLWASDNELYMQYGDDDKTIVFNIDTLYSDLASIVRMVTKEHEKSEKYLKEDLKKTLDEL